MPQLFEHELLAHAVQARAGPASHDTVCASLPSPQPPQHPAHVRVCISVPVPQESEHELLVHAVHACRTPPLHGSFFVAESGHSLQVPVHTRTESCSPGPQAFVHVPDTAHALHVFGIPTEHCAC